MIVVVVEYLISTYVAVLISAHLFEYVVVVWVFGAEVA